MYESWCRDLEEENEFARSYSILSGSFANPEMAQKMIKAENPDFESSEEDYEEASKRVLEMPKGRRRQRRKILQQSQ